MTTRVDLDGPADFPGWRAAARRLALAGVPPEAVLWRTSPEGDLFDSLRHLAVGRTVILASHAAAAHRFGARRIDLRDGRVVAARGAA